MSFKADLHIHTTASDGSMTPKEVVWHAKEVGLDGLSITDHDTIGAYPEALIEAKKAGLKIGTGVEFSSQYDGMSVHVLGYHFALDGESILDLCRRHRIRREKRNRAILENLKKENMFIAPEELKGELVGRPHIAHLMVKKGYVATIKEAFTSYLGEGRKCYALGDPISTEETLDAIRLSGGKSFLAHPHLLLKGPWVRRLITLPFDGIECYYARCHLEREKRWLKHCAQNELLISGGSDFHGDAKPFNTMGCSWVDQQAYDAIFEG